MSEPTKVKLAASEPGEDDKDEIQLDRVEYCPSTFNKQHAFKVAPPLPTFETMSLHPLVIEMLKGKLDIETPTSFQV